MSKAEIKDNTNVMQFPVKSKYKPETADRYTAGSLPESGVNWLDEVRQEALARVNKDGLPTPRLERWKKTNLIPAIKDIPATVSKCLVSFGDNSNARVISDLSEKLEEDWVRDLITAEPCDAAQYKDMMLWDLNTAYLDDATVIDVPKNTTEDQPITITINGESGTFTAPRLMVRVGSGAEVTIIEDVQGGGAYWRNRVTQILVEPNATVKHYRTQIEDDAAVYTQNTYARVARDARYETFTLGSGGKMVRHQIHVDLVGENADCKTHAVNLVDGSDHIDNTYTINHMVPHCTSNQFVRSVLKEQGHSVYQGKIHVFKDAQKTDAYQLSNALLLSDTAEMNVKPELEIYADDVVCSHGTTTGQIDEDALFYLRSRGVPEKEARGLLIQSFIGEVLDVVDDEDFREMCDGEVLRWLREA